MADFKPLRGDSQGCTSDVMYYDAKAKPTELYECATNRVDAARRMMEAFAGALEYGDERALPAVANAAALLLSDANSMFDVLYHVIKEHEELVKDYVEVEAFTR